MKKKSLNILAALIGEGRYEVWSYTSASLTSLTQATASYYKPLSDIGTDNLSTLNKSIKKDSTKMIEYIDYTLAGGYKASEIKNMSVNDFAKIGEPSGKGKANFLKGNEEDAYKFFKSRIEDTSKVEIKMAYYKDGKFKGVVEVGKDIYGNKIEFRRFSSTGGSFPTIDIFKTINGNEKKVVELKFKE